MSVLDRGPVSRPLFPPSPAATGILLYPRCQEGHEWFDVFAENSRSQLYALCARCGLQRLPVIGFSERALIALETTARV